MRLETGWNGGPATAGIALSTGDPRCFCNFWYIVAPPGTCHN
ncbi:MAG: hypothetical protein ACFB2W_06175 [Leptolyngbyaceae cyanobacterium]